MWNEKGGEAKKKKINSHDDIHSVAFGVRILLPIHSFFLLDYLVRFEIAVDTSFIDSISFSFEIIKTSYAAMFRMIERKTKAQNLEYCELSISKWNTII